MRQYLIVPIIVFLVGGCTGPSFKTSANANLMPNAPPDFILIHPTCPNLPSPYIETHCSKIEKNSEAHKTLPLEHALIRIRKETSENSINFGSAYYTDSAGEYVIIIDYAKYRDGEIKVPHPNRRNVRDTVQARVGVGVRIIANLTVNEENVDLGSVFSIAAAAKRDALHGQIEVLKIGIESPDLNMLVPPPSEINDTSLQNAIQAVAAIRAKLYDEETEITPHVLARHPTRWELIKAKRRRVR